MKKLQIKRISDGEVIKEINVSKQSERGIEKITFGIFRSIDTDKFFIEEVEEMSKPFDSLKPDPIRPEINGVANAISILERHKHIPGISEAIKNLYLYCEFVKSYHEQPKFWHEFKKEKGIE